MCKDMPHNAIDLCDTSQQDGDSDIIHMSLTCRLVAVSSPSAAPVLFPRRLYDFPYLPLIMLIVNTFLIGLNS